jgi:glycosyltransferase involved in cell wall biosynthesis
MRILMLHNQYQVRGGEDESADLEVALLRQYGHDVDLITFDNKVITQWNLFAIGLKAVWSHAAYLRVKKQLAEKEYDLVHIQNFFPLISPSVYYAAKAAKKPVVQALRNYRLVCLNALLFRAGNPCEDCLRQSVPWPGVVHRCYRSSLPGSVAVAAMLAVHRALGTWRTKVDIFYTLTEFAKSKLLMSGIPRGKIFVKPNLVYPDPTMGNKKGNYGFLAGRLVEEKGIMIVLDAWAQCQDHIPLMIAGEGPLSAMVEAASQRMPWITHLSTMPHEEVPDWMGEARFIVFPSELYETFSRVIVEAFAKGTPVIASNIGSTKELVEDSCNGLLFETGDSADLAREVQWAWNHPKEMADMGGQARKDYETKYSVKENYEKLMEIYQQAIENNRM